jgi:aryl-alcohol dehydrogenase-like predicted oxidoreductase
MDLTMRRPFGRTGLEVSPVALGTMQFGWTVTDVDSMRLLDEYTGAGGNLLDTANMYGGDQTVESFDRNKAHVGVSEDVIGRWLQSRGARDRVVIETKVRARMWDGPDGEGLSRHHILRAVDDSLRRLRTDYVDVLYAHWPDPTSYPRDWLGAFGELVAAGKVRHIGTSNFCGFEEYGDLLTPLLELADRVGLPRVEAEQPRYNLLNRRDYEGMLQPIAVREQLGIVTYSSLASGFLTGRYRADTPPMGHRGTFVQQYCTEGGWALLSALERIAHARGIAIAAVALAWTLGQEGVTSTIVGPDSVAELAACAGACQCTLSSDEAAELDHLSWYESSPEFVEW